MILSQSSSLTCLNWDEPVSLKGIRGEEAETFYCEACIVILWVMTAMGELC